MKPGGNYSQLKIDARDQVQPAYHGTVSRRRNRHSHAMFDTGAPATSLSLKAAERLGSSREVPASSRRAIAAASAGASSRPGWRPSARSRSASEEIKNARIIIADRGDNATGGHADRRRLLHLAPRLCRQCRPSHVLHLYGRPAVQPEGLCRRQCGGRASRRRRGERAQGCRRLQPEGRGLRLATRPRARLGGLFARDRALAQ